MQADKISAIVPVYNAEKYIEKCLNSLVGQTWQNKEIIIVNDGSQDKSGEICEKYAENHEFIKYIKQTNQGVSAARNAALDMAEGQYICFIDADDYADSDYMEKLHESFSYHSVQLSVCGYEEETEGYIIEYNNLKRRRSDSSGTIISAKEAAKRTFFDDLFNRTLWNKMFKKSIIEDGKLRFRVNQAVAEDFEFLLGYIDMIQRVYVIKTRLYHYVQRPESAIHKKTGDFLYTQRTQSWLNGLLNLPKAYSHKDKEWVRLYNRYCFMVKYRILCELAASNKQKSSLEKELLKFIRRHGLWAIKADIPIKTRIGIIMAMISPGLHNITANKLKAGQ